MTPPKPASEFTDDDVRELVLTVFSTYAEMLTFFGIGTGMSEDELLNTIGEKLLGYENAKAEVNGTVVDIDEREVLALSVGFSAASAFVGKKPTFSEEDIQKITNKVFSTYAALLVFAGLEQG